MATVLIRNIDDSVVDALKARARRNHRSLEAELRSILEDEIQIRPHIAAEQAPAYGDDAVSSTAVRYPDPDAPPFAPYDPIPVPDDSVSQRMIEER